MHIKRYAGLIANYAGEYKCQKCEEEGNQVKTEEGENTGGNHKQNNENKRKGKINNNNRGVP